MLEDSGEGAPWQTRTTSGRLSKSFGPSRPIQARPLPKTTCPPAQAAGALCAPACGRDCRGLVASRGPQRSRRAPSRGPHLCARPGVCDHRHQGLVGQRGSHRAGGHASLARTYPYLDHASPCVPEKLYCAQHAPPTRPPRGRRDHDSIVIFHMFFEFCLKSHAAPGSIVPNGALGNARHPGLCPAPLCHSAVACPERASHRI